jgi:hypothetical protein
MPEATEVKAKGAVRKIPEDQTTSDQAEALRKISVRTMRKRTWVMRVHVRVVSGCVLVGYVIFHLLKLTRAERK